MVAVDKPHVTAVVDKLHVMAAVDKPHVMAAVDKHHVVFAAKTLLEIVAEENLHVVPADIVNSISEPYNP